MIIENVATFPPRAIKLGKVISRILPQLDRPSVVFNEYSKAPEDHAGITKIFSIIPHEDTKDASNFYPEVLNNDYIFLIEEDIEYPTDYIHETLKNFRSILIERSIGSFYKLIYQKPKLGLNVHEIWRYARFFIFPQKIAAFRKTINFDHDLDVPIFVDQGGTGLIVMRGRNMPPHTYMRDSQNLLMCTWRCDALNKVLK